MQYAFAWVYKYFSDLGRNLCGSYTWLLTPFGSFALVNKIVLKWKNKKKKHKTIYIFDMRSQHVAQSIFK